MDNRTTTKREAANRANAAKSTGPKTEEGKRLSSHNALKTGLTGQTVLLPSVDVAAYESHIASVNERYQPRTGEERLHVQTIAHIEWRLLRIPALETGLLALGRKRFSECHAEEPVDVRAVLIDAEVLLEFKKDLANLALQENRLNRQHEKETAKLEKLQSVRRTQEAAHLQEAARLFLHCKKTEDTFHFDDLELFGFEFSMAQIHRRAAEMSAHNDHSPWPTIAANYRFHEFQKVA